MKWGEAQQLVQTVLTALPHIPELVARKKLKHLIQNARRGTWNNVDMSAGS